ncbi:MAG: acyl carrier protein [Oscillospiraceae bacterium]|nr:acyl carrier protein [Oscillospiraceae bacterium]
MEKLMEILTDLRPDLDFETEDKLIDDKVFDSFDIITAVSEINDAYDINIKVGDLIPENMNSVSAMWELIQKYQ